MDNSKNIWLMGFIDRGYTDLRPINCGYEKCLPHHIGRGNRDYYMIHYVESGCGRLFCGDREFFIEKGQIFIINPFEDVYYEADGDDPWQYIWIGFDGNMAKKLERLPSPVTEIPYNAFSMIKNIENRSDTREEVAAAALYLIFADLFSGRKSSHPHYVRRTVDTINSLYMTQLTVAGIAKSLGLDRRYLSRIFKESMGVSVQDYLIRVRLEQAQKLLSEGTSVKMTSQLVGYTDCFNFSKMFKKYYTVSPRHYAKINGNQTDDE